MIKKDIKSSELVVSSDGTLYHINLKALDNIPKNIFLVGDPKRAAAIAKYFDNGIEFENKNREFITLTGKYKALPVTVMSIGIGPDNAEIAAVELHVLNEYDHQTDNWKNNYLPLNIIRIGTSATPQKDISVGSLAVSQYSIGLDNTGTYYPYATPNQTVRAIQQILEQTNIRKVYPYVSQASPIVVNALTQGCKNIGLEQEQPSGFYVGLTSSAPGFYAPQGRKIGRLNNILIPDLQEILQRINLDGLRVINNEMETSVMFRLFNELLGYNVGAICAVIANRNKNEVISPEEYANSIDRAIKAGLEAMVILNS